MAHSTPENAPPDINGLPAGSAAAVARGGRFMSDCRILVVGAEAERLDSVLSGSKDAIQKLETASAAADWLWENGEEIRLVALDRSLFEQLDVQEFVALCERDWPSLKIVWV